MKPILTLILLMSLLLSLPAVGLAVGVGDAAPDFLVEDIPTGDPIALSDYRDQVVVLVFFAWW